VSDLVTVVEVCALGIFIVLATIGFVMEMELRYIRELLEKIAALEEEEP
jgi:hypothetical protein